MRMDKEEGRFSLPVRGCIVRKITDEMYPHKLVCLRREIHGRKQGHAPKVSIPCQSRLFERSRTDR